MKEALQIEHLFLIKQVHGNFIIYQLIKPEVCYSYHLFGQKKCSKKTYFSLC